MNIRSNKTKSTANENCFIWLNVETSHKTTKYHTKNQNKFQFFIITVNWGLFSHSSFNLKSLKHFFHCSLQLFECSLFPVISSSMHFMFTFNVTCSPLYSQRKRLQITNRNCLPFYIGHKPNFECAQNTNTIWKWIKVFDRNSRRTFYAVWKFLADTWRQ